jgi:hypothetical protein
LRVARVDALVDKMGLRAGFRGGGLDRGIHISGGM